jgi:hypothetical protein
VRVHQAIDQRQVTLTRGIELVGSIDCAALVSWRLLVGGLLALASHRSYSTTSEEPPLSHFNSYWDIPRSEAVVAHKCSRVSACTR